MYQLLFQDTRTRNNSLESNFLG